MVLMSGYRHDLVIRHVCQIPESPVSSIPFNPGGDYGQATCELIEGLIGSPGLIFLLAVSAVAFLIYLSTETIFWIRKIFNPLRYLKKIPMEIHIGRGDAEENKEEDETLEDPKSLTTRRNKSLSLTTRKRKKSRYRLLS